jgi:hypothetical protein
VALIIPAPISTTSVFERIVVSGIAKILKYKDTFKIAKNHKLSRKVTNYENVLS